MPQTEQFDLVIIGAGSGGLVMAAVAANLGFKVALCESNKMGGDCLNYGCVPSKALLAAAKHAYHARKGAEFGIHATPEVDFLKVNEHIHSVIDAIAPHDSQERFEGMGVKVVRTHAHFTGPDTVQAGELTLKARRFVVATGSRAFVPPIQGLDTVPYLTNENIFNLRELPQHLLVVGGGPIGCEMAQAFKRLGSRVTLIESVSRIMVKDDPQLSKVIEEQFHKEHINIELGATVSDVWKEEQTIHVRLQKDGQEHDVTGSHILVATGRKPNVENLGLKEAGVDHSARGIPVDKQLRTSNKNVFAIGDVVGPYQFTHMAGYQAGVVIGRSLFGNILSKVNYTAVPWCTYTDPELAHVGMTEEQAREEFGDKVRVTTFSFTENDRAQAEKSTNGMVKIMTEKGGRVVGASIVGPHAGELIHEWAMMVTHKMPIRKMTSVIHAYPTFSEINKRVAGEYYKDSFYSDRTRKISRKLFEWLG